MEASSAFPPPPMDAPRRPRGRPPSSSWAFFSTIVEPQKQPSAVCRHCNQLVHHRKKWGQARTHLMKCPQFLRLMDTLSPNEVPEWYLAEINRRQQSLVLNQSKPVAINNIPVFQNQIPTQTAATFKMIQPVPVAVAPTMMPMPMKNTENMAVKNAVNVDLKKLEEKVAMHLFTTMPVEKLVGGKVEFPFLLQTVQACSRDIELPKKEKLMTELLDRCFECVKGRVDGFFKSGLVPVTLSFDMATAGSQNDLVVNYMASLASSEKFPMYLELVKVPSTGDVSTKMEWAAHDVARVVEKLSCPVAGCVMPCSSPESQQTRELLEKQFPAMYFHGCMRDALWSLVRHIFTLSGATERKRSVTVPFVQDIQQFALQCKDLAFFLPRQKISYLREIIHSTTDMMHVTARRRLTVEDAFSAILQAEPFLDVDGVLNQLFSSGPNGESSDGSRHAHHPANIAHLQTQLVKIVRSPQFVEKLRKFLEVLRPVHTLLKSLSDDTNATSLLLSEVYSSFLRLGQQFASSTLLQPEEKGAMKALVRQQQENVLGSAHHLAYLLDPVLLGEDLPVDTKADVEQKLMCSFRADGTSLSDTDKEALYTQYMDFKKSALNQKTNKAETLVFRTLKERKKSPLQFWFADGAKWPVLQAIACRVFVVPVCAASSSRVVFEAGVALRPLQEKTDFLTSDKLTYVRANTRQLDFAEVVGSSLATVVQNPQNDSNANDITASMVV